MSATITAGGSSTDLRGTLRYVNDLYPGTYRRFYIITPANNLVRRGWQGHHVEEKAFFVINGAFTIDVVKPTDFFNPSKVDVGDKYVLTAENGALLKVPGGNFTCLKANTDNAMLLVLSSLTVEASQKDDYRLDVDFWKM